MGGVDLADAFPCAELLGGLEVGVLVVEGKLRKDSLLKFDIENVVILAFREYSVSGIEVGFLLALGDDISDFVPFGVAPNVSLWISFVFKQLNVSFFFPFELTLNRYVRYFAEPLDVLNLRSLFEILLQLDILQSDVEGKLSEMLVAAACQDVVFYELQTPDGAWMENSLQDLSIKFPYFKGVIVPSWDEQVKVVIEIDIKNKAFMSKEGLLQLQIEGPDFDSFVVGASGNAEIFNADDFADDIVVSCFLLFDQLKRVDIPAIQVFVLTASVEIVDFFYSQHADCMGVPVHGL